MREKESRGFLSYTPILAGLRHAVCNPDPAERLEQAVARGRGWQVRAFGEIADGFLEWLPVDASGMLVKRDAWATRGLRLTLDYLLGMELADGQRLAILPYVKEPVLASSKAEIGLRVLYEAIPTMLPGAEPMVLEVRSGREHRLPDTFDPASNDAYLRAAADRYLSMWAEAAAA
jgi:hypothetical protein